MAKLIMTLMYLCYSRTVVAFYFDDAEDVAGEDEARTAVAFCFCKVSGGK